MWGLAAPFPPEGHGGAAHHAGCSTYTHRADHLTTPEPVIGPKDSFQRGSVAAVRKGNCAPPTRTASDIAPFIRVREEGQRFYLDPEPQPSRSRMVQGLSEGASVSRTAC